MSPEVATVLMFVVLAACLIMGYPLGIVLGGVALLFGLITTGMPVFTIFHSRVLAMLTNYILVALPLFVFMGLMMEKSGAAEKLYEGLYLWFGRLRGGLAVSTVLLGTVVAATVGIIDASITLLGLVALPSMLKRGYNKELASGAVVSGGCLGIFIPPSIMLVLYGAFAQLSVGKLFMGAIVPGLLLSTLYCVYIIARCWLNPKIAPAMPPTEQAVSLVKRLYILLTAVLPPSFLILAVLGTIFFGIASPTEAASIGVLAAVLLAALNHSLNWQVIKETALETIRVTCIIYIIIVGASMFSSVFILLGGSEVIGNLVVSAPFGKWGIFGTIMFVIFILGFIMSWMGIFFIVIPLVTPIVTQLGFDPIWFALMVCLNFQTLFMTPPFSPGIFYLRAVVKPEWGITTAHIIRGVIPFIVIVLIALVLCALFPQIILWLPGIMIR